MKLSALPHQKSVLLLTFLLILFSASLASKVSASELINQLTSELGVTKQQAEGGTGSLLKLAGNHLSGTDFSTLTSAIPNASGLMSLAPAITGQSGTGFGLDSLSNLAGINQQFESLGLSTDMVGKFGTVIMNYLKGSSGDSTASLFESALPSGILGSAVPAMNLLN